MKPYTPTTLDSDLGYFELVIKVNIYIDSSYCVDILSDKPGQFFLLFDHKFFNPFHNADVSSRENVPSFP